MNADTTSAALDTLRSAGLLLDAIDFDGVLHRVPTADNGNASSGSCNGRRRWMPLPWL